MKVIYGAHLCRIAKETPPTSAEIEQLRHQTLYVSEDAQRAANQMRYGAKGRFGAKFDPRKYLYHKSQRTFPTGLLESCMGALHAPVLVGRPVLPPAQPWKIVPPTDIPGWAPRRAQLEAWEALTQAERGVAVVTTGSGKTILAAMLASSYPGETVLVTTPNLRLLNQNRAEIEAYLGEPVGILGDQQQDLAPRVVVATIQSLQSRIAAEDPEVLAWLLTVTTWLCDECHGASSDSYRLLSAALPNAHRRQGFTATWRREDGCQLVLSAVLSERVVYQFSYEDGVADGILAPIRVWLRPFKHHVGKIKPVKGQKRITYADFYTKHLANNFARNLQIIGDVCALVDAGMDPCLVMVTRKDHGKYLAKMLGCPYLDGADSSVKVGKKGEKVSKVDAVLDEFLYQKKFKVLVATNILNVGVNLRSLRSAVNGAGGDSSIDAEQKPGRGVRLWPGKTHFDYFDYLDVEPNFFGEHARKREFIYKKVFPGRVFRAIFEPVGLEAGASSEVDSAHDPLDNPSSSPL